jgi:AcrR family transcriptional regulator
MRTRLTKSQRRADILEKARQLIYDRGLARTEMEDIRLACGISRGGLYHHFSNKRAVLDALVEAEVSQLAELLKEGATSPIPTLLVAGSGHLGRGKGVLAALRTQEEKLDYLSALDQAFDGILRDTLAIQLAGFVRQGISSEHVAELFLTVNAHINRREIMGQWTSAQAAGFAATALAAMAPLLKSPKDLDPIISDLNVKALTP